MLVAGPVPAQIPNSQALTPTAQTPKPMNSRGGRSSGGLNQPEPAGWASTGGVGPNRWQVYEGCMGLLITLFGLLSLCFQPCFFFDLGTVTPQANPGSRCEGPQHAACKTVELTGIWVCPNL